MITFNIMLLAGSFGLGAGLGAGMSSGTSSQSGASPGMGGTTVQGLFSSHSCMSVFIRQEVHQGSLQ